MGTRLHDLATSPPSEALSSHGGGVGGTFAGAGQCQYSGAAAVENLKSQLYSYFILTIE